MQRWRSLVQVPGVEWVGVINRTELFKDVPQRTRAIMRAIRSTRTKPEVTVRKTLHALGFRFRLHRRDLPGTPDIVLARHRVVIFVHGCFWHQHQGCRHGKTPSQRQEYWLPKLARTQARDAESELHLKRLGWRVLVLWECEIADRERLAYGLSDF